MQSCVNVRISTDAITRHMCKAYIFLNYIQEEPFIFHFQTIETSFRDCYVLKVCKK